MPSAVCAIALGLWGSGKILAQTGADSGVTAETLVRGVENWCRSVPEIGGNAEVHVYFSPLAAASVAESEANEPTLAPGEPASRPKPGPYGQEELYWCAFDLSEHSLRVRLAEIVSSGFNTWRMPQAGPASTASPTRIEAEGSPVACFLSDEERTVQYDPRRLGPSGKLREALMLSASGESLGEELRRLLHGAYVGPTRRVAVEGEQVVAGLRCRRLNLEYETDWATAYWSVWVAPERGYMPVAFQSLLTDNNQPGCGRRYYRQVINIQEIGEGVYVPSETVEWVFIYRPQRPSNWHRVQRVCFQNLGTDTGTLERIDMPEQLVSLPVNLHFAQHWLPRPVEVSPDQLATDAERASFAALFEKHQLAAMPESDPEMDGPLPN